jgi:RND superfamily putative drug exporter
VTVDGSAPDATARLIRAVRPERVLREGDLTLLKVPVAGDPTRDAATTAVRRLREAAIPAARFPAGVEVLVGGETASHLDYVAVNDEVRPWVFAFVLGLSFVVLLLAFRSIVVPLKAILLNLLSVAAAYGLLVLVFQEGVGAGLLGLDRVETLEVWLPVLLFAILFGLSMDYHVFLLSRIRERYLETGDNAGAVAFGLGTTGRIITGAALIIVVVFVGFALGELVMFQQIGFGVAVALLLDATVVRSVLVPASMRLLGAWNWYLPRWLDWLPRVELERAPG